MINRLSTDEIIIKALTDSDVLYFSENLSMWKRPVRSILPGGPFLINKYYIAYSNDRVVCVVEYEGSGGTGSGGFSAPFGHFPWYIEHESSERPVIGFVCGYDYEMGSYARD